MDTGLNGKSVFVTCGSGGIGGAIAAAFAGEGAKVAIGWHGNEGAANALVARIAAEGGEAAAIRLDQSDPAAIEAATEAVTERLGPVDVLIGNAVAWPIGEAGWERSVATLTTNLTGTMALADALLPAMRERGWGRIVLISSDVVDQPVPRGGGEYLASKAGTEALARLLAVREAGSGVLTNVVRPGFTLTERALTAPHLGQAAIDAEAAETPTGRICTPVDVAAAVLFLGSGANTHANGQVLSVAGGRELTR